MHKVLIVGAGKIGTLITGLLHDSGRYQVAVADKHFNGHDFRRLMTNVTDINTYPVDAVDKESITQLFRKFSFDAVISCLPYHLNLPIAEAVKPFGIHYFDLTEDTKTTATIKELAADAQNAYVPQCGLAPGFIGIAANSLMQNFKSLEVVKLRVGALPQQVSNPLHYALTWSTEGIINEYGNFGYALSNGERVRTHPLEGLESMQIDGMEYEAFNTSGGIGSLIDLYHGKVNELNYKTIRYPGHCERIKFLMQDLKLNQDRETLKRILENAIPKTYQDLVLVYVSVIGRRDGQYLEESFVKKIYPSKRFNLIWSAIQLSTASGLCVVLDLLLSKKKDLRGYIFQEEFTLREVLANPFGKIFGDGVKVEG